MNCKFKCGDRIVIIDERDLNFLCSGTIDQICPYLITVLLDSGSNWACLEEKMEFEAIYNSPLYQALQ
jgi:hypothetical protein